MKDQKALLMKCLQNDVPAIVISGNDQLAIPVLEKYLREAIKAGCDEAFIKDFQDVLTEFKIYQLEEAVHVKKPD